MLHLLFLAWLLPSALAKYDPEKLTILSLGGRQGKDCPKDETAHKFDKVAMHYTGWVGEGEGEGVEKTTKGKKFDSSLDRDATFDVQIGKGNVIKGWDFGLVGLCVGAKRRLIIHPDYGYGDNGAGDAIPGGATLIFDVELVNIITPRKKKKRFFGKAHPKAEDWEETAASEEKEDL